MSASDYYTLPNEAALAKARHIFGDIVSAAYITAKPRYLSAHIEEDALAIHASQMLTLVFDSGAIVEFGEGADNGYFAIFKRDELPPSKIACC
jgi:hypothetical protein